MRKNGINCLSKCLSNKKNIYLFEKYIYNIYDNNNYSQDEYFQIIYNTCGYILKKQSLKKIFNELKCGKYFFKNSEFDEIQKEQKEQDDFSANPFEVSEGVLECKCGSNKTISYPLQTRSSDEKTSIFVCCTQCGKKWVE